jgi:hypothetical protein
MPVRRALHERALEIADREPDLSIHCVERLVSELLMGWVVVRKDRLMPGAEAVNGLMPLIRIDGDPDLRDLGRKTSEERSVRSGNDQECGGQSRFN